MPKKQKTQVVNFVNDYWKLYNHINNMIINGQLPMFNLAELVNQSALYMRAPEFLVKGKVFDELDEFEKDEFFKRKNEYYLINKIINRAIREIQNGNPIANTFECDMHDQQAQLSAMYKLVRILFYAVLPIFQTENGLPYYYLIGFVRQIVDNYYADVKDDKHLENRYRDPTITQILDNKIGKTAEQAAQLQKYSRFNGITHEFKIYNDLIRVLGYVRTSIIKYYPKNTSKTIAYTTEQNLINAIEMVTRANSEPKMLSRINAFISANETLRVFIADLDMGYACHYISHHRYLTITDKILEIQKMMTSLINKLTTAYNNGQTNAFEPLKQTQTNNKQVQTIYPKGSIQNSGYNITYFKPQNINGINNPTS